MNYSCKNCEKSFNFPEGILFCPFCAASLHSTVVSGEDEKREAPISEMDYIWGDAAKTKERITALVNKLQYMATDYMTASIGKGLTTGKTSEFKKRYAVIKKSQTRGELFERLEKTLADWREMIEHGQNAAELAADTAWTAKLKNTVTVMQSRFDAIADAAGIKHHDKDAADDLLKKIAAVETGEEFTREQLDFYLQLTTEAYSKYKRAVTDNDIFAAFATQPQYGTTGRRLKGLFFDLDINLSYGDDEDDYPETGDNDAAGENEDEETDSGIIRYELAVKELQEMNALPYKGMLDEEFMPHVEAFWFALEKLAGFIDGRFSSDYSACVEALYKLAEDNKHHIEHGMNRQPRQSIGSMNKTEDRLEALKKSFEQAVTDG